MPSVYSPYQNMFLNIFFTRVPARSRRPFALLLARPSGRWPSGAKALLPLSLSTVASRACPPSNGGDRISVHPIPRIPLYLFWECETAGCQCSAVSFYFLIDVEIALYAFW